MTKKVLMICYSWPPAGGVGWLRALSCAKHLRRFGWEPVVITVKKEFQQKSFREKDPAEDAIRVIETDYEDIVGSFKGRYFGEKDAEARGRKAPRKALCHRVGDPIVKRVSAFIREMIAIPDEQRGWEKHALGAAFDELRAGDYQAVFSTSPPETAHLIACEIKKRTGLPWVADLRDLWSGYHFYYRGFIKTMRLRMMEKDVLGHADAVITVSEPWADELRKLHGRRISKEKIHVVTNGYDEESYPVSGSRSGADPFLIVYTGKLHKKIQDPEIFFLSVSELVREGKIDRSRLRLEFYLYGYDRPDIKKIAAKYSLDDVVFEEDAVSHKRCMEILKKAHALLFFGWSGRGAYGHFSAKIFEYLGSRRPIIAVLRLRSSCVGDLIARTKSGYSVTTKDQLKIAILKLYDEYEKRGVVLYNGVEEEIGKYARLRKAEELSRILESVRVSRKVGIS